MFIIFKYGILSRQSKYSLSLCTRISLFLFCIGLKKHLTFVINFMLLNVVIKIKTTFQLETSLNFKTIVMIL